MKKSAIFLDLDGTIRHAKDGKFINKASDVALFSGVVDALKSLRASGFLLIGITNQGGVAVGKLSIPNLQKNLDRTQELLGESRLDDVPTTCTVSRHLCTPVG